MRITHCCRSSPLHYGRESRPVMPDRGTGSLENFPHLAHTTPELRVREFDSEAPSSRTRCSGVVCTRWGKFSRETRPRSGFTGPRQRWCNIFVTRSAVSCMSPIHSTVRKKVSLQREFCEFKPRYATCRKCRNGAKDASLYPKRV